MTELTIFDIPIRRPPPFLQQNPHPSRVPPIPRMHFARLKHRLQPQGRHSVHDRPGQRVVDRLFFADSAALGSRSGSVEVERVDALVVFVGFGVLGCGTRVWGGLELRLQVFGGFLLAGGGGRGDLRGTDEGGGVFGGVFD